MVLLRTHGRVTRRRVCYCLVWPLSYKHSHPTIARPARLYLASPLHGPPIIPAPFPSPIVCRVEDLHSTNPPTTRCIPAVSIFQACTHRLSPPFRAPELVWLLAIFRIEACAKSRFKCEVHSLTEAQSLKSLHPPPSRPDLWFHLRISNVYSDLLHPPSSLPHPSQQRDYYGFSRAGPRYRLHSRLKRHLLNSLDPQTPLLLLSLHAALQHSFHTARQDQSTSEHQKSHFNSFYHSARRVFDAGPLVVSTSRTPCIRTLMLQCRLHRHVPSPPKLFFWIKMHNSHCHQRLLLHCNRLTTVCISLGLVLQSMPCFLSRHHLADHHAQQSSTFSSLRLWTGARINTFDVSCFQLANMFLACYGKSHCLNWLLVAQF